MYTIKFGATYTVHLQYYCHYVCRMTSSILLSLCVQYEMILIISSILKVKLNFESNICTFTFLFSFIFEVVLTSVTVLPFNVILLVSIDLIFSYDRFITTMMLAFYIMIVVNIIITVIMKIFIIIIIVIIIIIIIFFLIVVVTMISIFN